MMKKLFVLVVSVLLGVLATVAQEPQSAGRFLVTVPEGFSIVSNSENSFQVTRDSDGAQINFATIEELAGLLGADSFASSQEAFDALINALTTLGGAEFVEGELPELVIFGAVVPVSKLKDGASGDILNFGIVTFPDESLGLIGYSEAVETEVELIAGIYESVVIEAIAEPTEDPTTEPEVVSGGVVYLRPSEMPEGKMIMVSELGNLTFDVPEGFATFSDDPVQGSAVLLSDDFMVTLLVSDLGVIDALTIDGYSSTYFPMIASMVGITDVITPETLEREDGIDVRFFDARVISPDLADDALMVAGFLLAQGNRFVMGQISGLGANTTPELVAEFRAIAETLVFEPAGATAEPLDITPISALDEPVIAVGCFDSGRDYLSPDTQEGVFECPSGCGTSSTWGTELYTSDSSLCTAAIHMGVISKDGGVFRASYEDGQTAYVGSTQNGVTTSNYGAWSASFSVRGLTDARVAVPLSATEITCSARGYDVVDERNLTKRVICPSNCSSGSVWGTDTYTNDSAVCLAAIHAGVISASDGGEVLVSYADGLSAYVGSTQNGVTTSNYGVWNSSFTVAKP